MRKVVFLVSVLMMFILLAIPTFAQTSEAYIRIGHFALNVGDADVLINGELRSFGRDREFGSVSSWLLVPAGEVTVEVRASGRSRALIGPATLTLEPGSRTNILAIGDSRTMGVDPLIWTESEDELSEYYARVTIVHAHPTAGIVDLLNDGELYLGRLAYPGDLLLADGSSNDGIVTTDVLAGSYDLTVVPNGQSGPVLIDLTDTALEAGMEYLVVATVDADGNPTAVVAATAP